MSMSILIALWILITGVGFVVEVLNLVDAVQVLRWQWASAINGTRRLLAKGHVRTAALQTAALGAALAIGIEALMPMQLPSWVGIVLLFAIVVSLCVASVYDRRDRHKVVEE